MLNLTALLESLLFAYGESISLKKLAKALKISEKDLEKAATDLDQELQKANRGLTLIKHADSIQLVTKTEFSDEIKKLVKQEVGDEITPAALETLSIIAYSGPISKAGIEHVRGVNSSFTLRNLMMRGLIEKQSNEKAVGNIYSVSSDFLKYLGLTGIGQLPEYQKYNSLVKKDGSQ